MSLISEFDAFPSEMYPSPISSPATVSPQPTMKHGIEGDIITSAAKSAASHKPVPKRKRENRYKNAPPSVLSVSCRPPPIKSFR
ncbi:hypothetical protein IMZ48_26945 [Candidatus Bathyarchaeota archaeon]|nr:hypothetical protein [Candidatus Bathyarchaeota archaeon]